MLKFKNMHEFYQDPEFQIYSLPLLITNSDFSNYKFIISQIKIF